MPGGDRTGPMGQGPLTGRGLGFCSGNTNPSGLGLGRGYGQGLGRGFGRGYWGRGRFFNLRYNNPVSESQVSSKEDEKVYLEDLVKNLEKEIKDVHKRIQELTKEKEETK